MKRDYRNRYVRLARLDDTLPGEPATADDQKRVGWTGYASSIYEDGRPSHDEGYLVKFADGYVGTYVAEELEPLRESERGSYETFSGPQAQDYVKREQNFELFPFGRAVEIVDKFNGGCRVVCKGWVERVTATQIHVRNEHRNLSKFRLLDLKMVGYAWPQLTNEVRQAK
jgi:hypothetical protein